MVVELGYRVAIHEIVGAESQLPTWSDSNPMELREAVHLVVSIIAGLAKRDYGIRGDLNDSYTWYCENADGGLIEISIS